MVYYDVKIDTELIPVVVSWVLPAAGSASRPKHMQLKMPLLADLSEVLDNQPKRLAFETKCFFIEPNAFREIL